MKVSDYLIECNSYTKKVVFVYGKTNGGIGDLIKYFTYLLQVCIKHKIRLYLRGSRIDRYLKIDNRFYISTIEHQLYLDSINHITSILDSVLYVVYPQTMYAVNNLFDSLTIPLCDIFDFSNEVLERAAPYVGVYESLHLRLGDTFLEDTCALVINDERKYDEAKMFAFMQERNIFFFCDNKSYKQKIKNKFNVQMTDFDIGHTTDAQILDCLAEFYLLSKSTHIYKASYSGYSIMASKMYNCPISDI
jgi:hypothetical protein